MALIAAVTNGSSTVETRPVSKNGKLSKSISQLAQLTGLDESEVRLFPCLNQLRQLIDDYNLSSNPNAAEILRADVEKLQQTCSPKKHLHIYCHGLGRLVVMLERILV